MAFEILAVSLINGRALLYRRILSSLTELMKDSHIFRAWKEVFSNWKYLVLTFTIAVLFYSLNVLLSNWRLVLYHGSLGLWSLMEILLALLLGFKDTVKLSSFFSLIILSILFGVLLSLLIYKMKMISSISSKTGIFASIGIFLGMLAPGCAACGFGLLSLMGLSSAFLSFLPFEGLEISLLAIGIISISVLHLSKNLYSCDVPLTKRGRIS